MRRISTKTGNSGAHTSPGTPEHEDGVILTGSNIRRQIGTSALVSLNNGKALPSKWDDAERWITSPVSGIGFSKNTVLQPQKKPKSKSGPLGPPGVMCMANYSPTMAVLESGNGNKYLMAGSPLMTGVLVSDGLSIQYPEEIGMKSGSVSDENPITMSTNPPESSSDLDSKFSSVLNSQDNGSIEVESVASHVVSRRDMATQMSPEGSTSSSFSIPPSGERAVDLLNNRSNVVEVRDVQVDRGATITRQSKKQCPRKLKKKSSVVKELACPWGGVANNKSKLRREEAKITAWENLQKAKAEASIRKLEVKLEKKRSASLDKILNKLRAAQMKAQATRRSLTDDNQDPESSKKSPKMFLCKCLKSNSMVTCFFRRRT